MAVMTKMTVTVVIVLNVYMTQVIMMLGLVTCKKYNFENNIFYIFLFYWSVEFYIKERVHYK